LIEENIISAIHLLRLSSVSKFYKPIMNYVLRFTNLILGFVETIDITRILHCIWILCPVHWSWRNMVSK